MYALLKNGKNKEKQKKGKEIEIYIKLYALLSSAGYILYNIHDVCISE